LYCGDVSISNYDFFSRNHTANEEYCLSYPVDQDPHVACEGCLNVVKRSGALELRFDTTTTLDIVRRNLDTILAGDFVTLALASFLVAVAVARDLDDVLHCRALRGAIWEGEGVAPPGRVAWHNTALAGIETLRQFTLVPIVALCVPQMLLYLGADAISVCFNTLAFLFLLECDNVAFTLLTPQHQVGSKRVQPSQSVEANTMKLKTGYIFAVVMPIVLTPILPRNGVGLPMIDWPGFLLVLGSLFVAALMEAKHSGGKYGPIVRRWLLGNAAFGCILLTNLGFSHGWFAVVDGLHVMFGLEVTELTGALGGSYPPAKWQPGV
jgi:hypothetical protein